MTNEEIISNFLQTAYTDERLAALLAHAEDGKLAFHSCCCLVGIPSAKHPLRGYKQVFEWHVHDTKETRRVEEAFLDLAPESECEGDDSGDAYRREALIPLVHAEMARRETQRATVRDCECVAV